MKFWFAVSFLTIGPLFALVAAYELMTRATSPRPFMTHGMFVIGMALMFLGLWLLD